MRNLQPMRVFFIAAEAEPFVKVGGLGDVAGSLPRAIHKLNQHKESKSGIPGGENRKRVDVRIALPFHGAIASTAHDLQPIAVFDVPHPDGPLPAVAYHLEMDGIPVYLISGNPILPEYPVYSNDPIIDGNKYTFFSLAALELARTLAWQPHILHANEWHTGPAIYALSLRSNDSFFSKTAKIMGIHNLPYLGTGVGPVLSVYGLPPASTSHLPEWAQHLPMPLGLLAADHLVAVSPTYAQEILTPEYGSGLADFLQERAASISGILNGLDTEKWDPQTDPYIAANYSWDNLEPRSLNKLALQQELGLAVDPDLPLMGMVTRMEDQKGVDLALDALCQIDLPDQDRTRPWQAVFLGTGMPELENAARRLQVQFPDRVRAIITFDTSLSRRIYAGADMLLIPSRYEPCGLTQMIAMRYGCVPIARSTGGLKDTIRPIPDKKGSGFLFSEPKTEALSGTIRDALQLFQDRKVWQKLSRRGMRQDFSWARSAQAYLSLYRSLIRSRRQG